MRTTKQFIGLAILPALVIMLACSGSNDSNGGVSRIEDTVASEVEATNEPMATSESTSESTSETSNGPDPRESARMTDEEITTRFTTCMRAQGLDIPDPTLNADGSVDMMALRESFANAPGFDPQSSETQEAFRQCAPLLEGATFARAPSAENQVEMQDNLVKFTECLRENDVDVEDPDFSADIRQQFGQVFQSIDFNAPKTQEVVQDCSTIFNQTGGSE